MKRLAGAVVLVTVLMPSPALAHTANDGGGSGVSLPLLIAGAAVLVVALAARAKLPTVGVWSALAAGVALIVGSLFVGGDDGGRPDVHVAVTAPADGATVTAGEPVTVQVDVDGPLAKGPEDPDGGHLHLSIDGKLQQMPYAVNANVTLEPGSHTLTVEYVDHEHLSYDPPIAHTIDVEAT